MPYIAIKAYPKDEETKRKLVERINQDILEIWGCPQEAVSISVEEVAPSDWESKVVAVDYKKNHDKMYILSGKNCHDEGEDL